MNRALPSALVTSLSSVKLAFADQPAIGREIENRFRYFQKASDLRVIAKVYESIKTAANRSFHPNALGHAAIADSVLVHLGETLKCFKINGPSNGRKLYRQCNIS
jgi:hypothetical protein